VVSREYKKVNGESIPLYQSEFRLITKEKNIINIDLEERQYAPHDKTIKVNKDFPYLSLFLVL
jgi:hypothetical protein